LYEETVKILKKSEEILVSIKSRNRIIKFINRHITFQLAFITIGYQNLFSPSKKWAIFLGVPLIPIVLLYRFSFIDFDTFGNVLLLCALIAFWAVVFGTPSSFVFSGLSNNRIFKIKEVLKNSNIANTENIELFESNLQKIQIISNNRISSYRRMVTMVWGVFVFYLGISKNLIFNIPTNNFNEAFSELVSLSFMASLMLLFALILISSYQRSTDLLIRHIEFALVDLKKEYIKA